MALVVAAGLGRDRRPTMATARYIALVLEEENGYAVVFPDFPGAGSGGATIDEALARAEDNLAAHVEGRFKAGLDVPRPRSVEAIKADPEVAEDLATMALIAAIPVALPDKSIRLSITVDE